MLSLPHMLGKTIGTLSHGIRSLGQDLNVEPLEYEAGMPTTQP
jgi:hypothetical protein